MKQIYLHNKDKRTLEKILDLKDGWGELNHFTIRRTYIGEEANSSIVYSNVGGYANLQKIYSKELPIILSLKIKIKEMM